MSEDNFDAETPTIEFEQDKLELCAYAGEPFESTLEMHSSDQTPIRGMVYTSNPYLICLNPHFEGTSVSVPFRTLNSGFKAGDTLTGHFTVVADCFVKEIPFRIVFASRFPTGSDGTTITTLEEFADYAREHWNDALRLFMQPSFLRLIESASDEVALLYNGYRTFPLTSANFEEFLIASKLKQPVSFRIDESPLSFSDITENEKISLSVTKSTWGYTELLVQTDADFLSPGITRATSDFFVGGELELPFYIHGNYLHDGKNQARILITSRNFRCEIPVTVMVHPASRQSDDTHRIYVRTQEKLTELYIDYRLRKITTGEWSDRSVELYDRLIDLLGDQTCFFRLMKAQALIINRRRQDALWIISDLKREIADKKSVQWAYLLYLCTLIEPETSYVDRLTHEIEIIFRQHPNDPRIFWFLLFLREEYVDDSHRKMKDLRQWIDAGISSPYYYVEAYQLFCRDPLLLRLFDDFTIKILGWACRHKALYGNVALALPAMLRQEKTFRPRVFDIAAHAYELYPEDELFEEILHYLLRCRCFGEEFFSWYEKAIEREENIAGLYEAYLYSVPTTDLRMLPETVSMYFGMDSALPYDRKAFVCAGVILYKKEAPNLYRRYLPMIESFAMEQMRLGRMDDNLALIYQDILDAGIIDEDVADAIGGMLAPTKIICLTSDIRRVILLQDSSARPVFLPVVDHIAYAAVHSPVFQIFLEDDCGRILTDENLYYTEPLLRIDGFYEKLRDKAQKKLPYYLYDLDRCGQDDEISIETPELVEDFLTSEEISETYKSRHYPRIIRFLRTHMREDIFEQHLLSLTDFQMISSDTMAYIIDLYILSEQYEKACDLLANYNGTKTPLRSLLRLFDYCIEQRPDQSDDFMILVCAHLMEECLTTERTLRYLTRFYVGPTRLMAMLWKYARGIDAQTTDLEERFLTQMLFTEEVKPEYEEIFASYLAHRPNRMIIEAYLTYESRRCLLEDHPLSQTSFQRLLHLFSIDEKLNEGCRLALLKTLALTNHLPDDQYEALDRLLGSCIRRNLYFDFYRKTDLRLLVKYHLYDKVFVTYRGRPRMRLLIRWTSSGDQESEQEMVEMYDGIYVRQFVLFFGETLSCRIVPADGSQEVLAESTVGYEEILDAADDTRFGLLNRMQSSLVYYNEKDLLLAMKTYQGLEKTTDQLFELI